MKKTVLLFMVLAGALTVQANDSSSNDDYPFLTFETSDGSKTSVSSTELTITIKDGKLTAGSTVFTLADLSKMYFSTFDETMGIEDIEVFQTDDLQNAGEIYDLNGRKIVNHTENRKLPSGIYVIKTKTGTRKIQVK